MTAPEDDPSTEASSRDVATTTSAPAEAGFVLTRGWLVIGVLALLVGGCAGLIMAAVGSR